MSTIRIPEQNQVFLAGRLTRDPELRFTQKGQAVCHFDLAANRRYRDGSGEWKDDVTFVPVVVWREIAQRCKERLKKGSPVCVEGRLRGREYEDKSGNKRKVLEVDARRVQFLQTRDAAQAGADPVEEGAEPDAPETANVNSDSEEVPF
ncbi:MAG: single-stranded DNA-binding protein [Elusimicrobia bacterium]|nr:single-stranded DNA-binding protein [Elusimicrobiota bacterium]